MENAPLAPMEALLAEQIPTGDEWRFEPKWDGFRCLAVRSGDQVWLWSKSGKPLGRYFPEMVELFGRLAADAFVLDGELVIQTAEGLSFDALQMRLHPAESRVRKLAAETPSMFVAFDLLELGGRSLANEPLDARRHALEQMLASEDEPALLLSPVTTDRDLALEWLHRSGAALDGVIAKRSDQPYTPGERTMVKVKQRRTADCVVGGFRYDRKGEEMASLLLGLHDASGQLHHVGYCSSIPNHDKPGWTAELRSIAGGEGFGGGKPGGPSRWATERSTEWTPVRPEIVVEVLYDQVTAGRFRHGTKLLRRRPDKAPSQCTMEQLRHPLTPAELGQLLKR
ncbi:ATP-dependent DNA ligase [Sphingomonas ginkgonis]|uniref:DNA ligase (ATP) n=2 Tax=Sphingomonas ginkgonis TaxID=2315330 RepID=A0A3R9YPB7_9SPHN|nr:ATP-dependent DNA ligase [Sphingomonas ginkgonis]